MFTQPPATTFGPSQLTRRPSRFILSAVEAEAGPGGVVLARQLAAVALEEAARLVARIFFAATCWAQRKLSRWATAALERQRLRPTALAGRPGYSVAIRNSATGCTLKAASAEALGLLARHRAEAMRAENSLVVPAAADQAALLPELPELLPLIVARLAAAAAAEYPQAEQSRRAAMAARLAVAAHRAQQRSRGPPLLTVPLAALLAEELARVEVHLPEIRPATAEATWSHAEALAAEAAGAEAQRPGLAGRAARVASMARAAVVEADRPTEATAVRAARVRKA